MSAADLAAPAVDLTAPARGPASVREASGGLQFGPAADRLADDYDVLLAYQVFLGRDPEDWSAIQARLDRPIRAIAQEFVRSGEFVGLTAEPTDGGARLVHARSRVPLTTEQIAWVADLLDLPRDQLAALKRAKNPPRSFVVVHLDAPAPGEALPARGALQGRGWVVANCDVEGVSIYLDDKWVCRAALEPPAAEAARRFPHYGVARRAGFRFSAGLRGRGGGGGGRPMVVVGVRTVDGATTHKIVPMAIPAAISGAIPGEADAALGPAAAGQGAAIVRTGLPRAEIARRHAALARLSHNPFFMVIVPAPGVAADDARAIQATLRSLQGQAYANWRAVVVLPEGCSEVRAATAIGAAEPHLLGRVRLRARGGEGRAGLLPWPDLRDPRFVVVLRAGERLAPEALLEFASASAADPAPDFIVSGDTAGAVQQPGRPRRRSEPVSESGRIWCAACALVQAAGVAPEQLAGPDAEPNGRRLALVARAVARVPRGVLEGGDAVPENAPGGRAARRARPARS